MNKMGGLVGLGLVDTLFGGGTSLGLPMAGAIPGAMLGGNSSLSPLLGAGGGLIPAALLAQLLKKKKSSGQQTDPSSGAAAPASPIDANRIIGLLN